MRINKKIFICVALVVLLFSFTSCKEDNKDKVVENNLKFDFGIDEKNKEEGWTTITVPKSPSSKETDYKYTKEKGYGFLKDGVYGKKESNLTPVDIELPENVYSDYAIADGNEFVVDLDNGFYTVSIVVATSSKSMTNATVEGVNSRTIGVQKKYDVAVLENIEVKDGQLNIKIEGIGTFGGLISAIAIDQVDAPKNLLASVDFEDKNISLTWEASKGAESYNIYRKDSIGKITKISSVKETSYKDKEVEVGEEYTYSIKASVDTGAESAATNEVLISFVDGTTKVPNPVSNLLVSELTKDKTVLSWEESKDADSYAVYWSDRELKSQEKVKGYTLLEKTDKTTVTFEASTYQARYFKVVAINNGGFSEHTMVKSDIGIDSVVQLEYLDRGVVAVKTEVGVYVGFRLLADEFNKEYTFEIYRDNKKIADILADNNTNYIDKEGTIDSKYVIKAIDNGVVVSESKQVSVMSEQYFDVPITAPTMIKLPSNESYSYNANDMSVGDVDGDGVYELFVKWEPSNAQDNSKGGYTGPVYIDCYKLDGTLLWRINLGINIRAGAHYTQFMVFDFDGDGIAELMCKTSDASVDGTGKVIGNKDADYRNDAGYVLTGNEYLTLFDGKTGKELDTIDYNPQRGSVDSWGDNYGNRVDRFLAGVAYLDGEKPSAIFARGYYTRAVVVAYDIVDKKIVEKWVIDSNDSQSKALAGQGAHNLNVGDVDMDGYHEIIYGSAVIDHDGTLLYSTRALHGSKHGGHGDAVRVGDHDLLTPGLEIFMVHEEYPSEAGIELRAGSTGNYLYGLPTTTDVGRGSAGDIDPRYLGAESWAVGTDEWNSPTGYLMTPKGEVISNNIPAANFMIWWDGDLGREILDHKFSSTAGAGTPIIYEWDYENSKQVEILTMTGTYSNNYTKGNPNLQADIFGDWREEVLVRTTDNKNIRIYTTTDFMDFRIHTLMHDPMYRCSVAWQNTAYNQPTETSFYIGFDRDYIEIPRRNVNIVKK